MKTCVYQIKISDNNYLGKFKKDTKNFHVFEKKICIPSVKQWAFECGYDYKLIETPTIKRNGFYTHEADWYASEKLIQAYDEKYDYMIYVDTDIFVRKKEAFPLIPGLSIVEEKIPDDRFFRTIDDRSKNIYYNSGVFSLDQSTGYSIKSFFLDYINNKSSKGIEYGDQDILNKWILNNGCNSLDDKWNYLLYNELSLTTNKNFFHFVGINKQCFQQKFSQIRRIKI